MRFLHCQQPTRSISCLITGLCMVLGCFACDCVHAQMFGDRSVGSPLGRSSRGIATGADVMVPSAGLLEGNERFIRGNRSRREFVGSDRTEQSGFVGAGQAIGVGRVRTATEGLEIDAADTQRINRPLPSQPAKGMYYPRLEVGFDVSSAVSPRTETDPSTRIRERVANVAGDDAQVVLSGRTAILRGRVNSQHTAELVGLILGFEPGIDEVQNELTVP